jgi:spore maturation protein CgeB
VINSILYIGSLNPFSNSFRRFETYKQLVEKVDGIDIDSFIYSSITKKFDHHLNFGIGTIRLNAFVKNKDFSKYDALIIDNRPFLFRQTLKAIKQQNPSLKIALVLTDDPNGKYKSGWRLLKKTARDIDVHFVQREQNIEELLVWGAKRVKTCFRSFDPTFHRMKSEVQKNTTYDVGFIGSYEENREESIKYLIENGIKVQVTGDGWENGKYFNTIMPFYTGKSLYGEAYVDCINQMKIALHFLRHGNRDEQDSRTFEIPACGTPMIAEYSNVHNSLFKDHHEVLFFKSKQELLEKVLFLMDNPEIASRYAENAKVRCIVDGYDHHNTLKKVLKTIEE